MGRLAGLDSRDCNKIKRLVWSLINLMAVSNELNLVALYCLTIYAELFHLGIQDLSLTRGSFGCSMNDSLVVHNRQLARRARDYRLGSVFTEVPVYRTGRGSNVVSIGLGKDADDIQSFNLTLCESTLNRHDPLGPLFACTDKENASATCVNHLLLATSKCSDCLEDSDG